MEFIKREQYSFLKTQLISLKSNTSTRYKNLLSFKLVKKIPGAFHLVSFTIIVLQFVYLDIPEPDWITMILQTNVTLF